MEKNVKKTINAWCMYDWANSVYSLTITTAVFPEYYLAVTADASTNNQVNFFGWTFNNSVLYSYALSVSFLIAAFLSPFLTSVADYTGRKKLFMQLFCYLGSFSCAYLFFFTKANLNFAMLAFILAAIGYSGSIVFYNSFLPEIATDDQADKVSAKGYAYGYVGSVLLLIINLLMILQPAVFGFQPGTSLPARVSFLTVGIWWFGFAQYTFHHLPDNVYGRKPQGNWLLKGFSEIFKVLKELKTQHYLKRFLIAFFFYNMGVQTVMYMATIFGKSELKLVTAELISVVLVIQIIAIFGANVFAKLSANWGNVKAITVVIIVWIAVCIAAYFVASGMQFYGLAVVVGFVMGGIQSLSRSTYSKLIPQNTIDHASYFSFYDVMEKVSTFGGTFMFGYIASVTGGMRNSALGLTLFFVIGLIFLLNIPSKKQFNIIAKETDSY